MIIEWLLDLVVGVVDWFLSLFDGFELPDIVTSPSGSISTLAANVQGMGVWVPWGVVAGAVGASLGVWGVMFIVKLVKQVLAHVPGFGGAG